jgi:hypothetical protein
VLPDGRTFAGVVKTGRGFRGTAWIAGYPPSAGVRLIVRNASGQQVTTLGTARPDGPPALGGIPVSFGGGGTNTKAFGYAPANVTRVVLSFRGGEGSAKTFAAGSR